MWSKGGKEAESSERRGEMFWMWEERTQEMEMSKYEEEKAGGSGTTARGVG